MDEEEERASALPALDLHQRRAGGLGAAALAKSPGERGHGRPREELGQRKGAAEALLDPRHQADGEQRVPAERKEVVADPDRVDAEELLPEVRQRQLDEAAGQRERLALVFALLLGCGERLPGDLALRRAGQLRE